MRINWRGVLELLAVAMLAGALMGLLHAPWYVGAPFGFFVGYVYTRHQWARWTVQR